MLNMELQITLSGWILRPKTSASWATWGSILVCWVGVW